MKLSLLIDDRQIIVTWNKPIVDFPSIVSHNDKYWQYLAVDDDKTGVVDKILYFGEIRKIHLPIDMYGKIHPVQALDEMFDLYSAFRACECGAKFTEFPEVHLFMCPKWSKT